MTQQGGQPNNDLWITGTVLAAVQQQDEKGDAYLEVEIQTERGDIYAATIANWSQYQWPGYVEGQEVTCGLKQKRSGGYYIFATKGYTKPAGTGQNPAPAGGEDKAKAPAGAPAARTETKASPGGAVNRGEYLYSVTKSEADLRADVFNHTSRLWAAGCAGSGVTFHAFMEACEGYILRGEKDAEKFKLYVPPTAASK